jgi:hypothetical protein
MERNFDIHQWQAKFLKEGTVNEAISVESTAIKVKADLETALARIEHFKKTNLIASNENPFNDVEVDIEEALLTLGHLG